MAQAACFADNPSPFRVFSLQTLVVEGAGEEEGDEFLMRYNMNGIELNEEGFQKLTSEISLFPSGKEFPHALGQRTRHSFIYGEVPLGESVEPIVVRRGMTAASYKREEKSAGRRIARSSKCAASEIA